MQDVTFPSGSLNLHGAMYKPAGTGPFPAILYNHGSWQDASGDVPEVAQLFTSRGYVFFLPHRRGHGRSSNQGPFIVDMLQNERRERGVDAWSKLMVKLHETDHLEDQLAALAFLKRQSFVDRERITIGGCSFGGIQTVLASERALGVVAALDFAGAAMTWATAPDMRERLSAAARRAKAPIFSPGRKTTQHRPEPDACGQMQRAGKPHKNQDLSCVRHYAGRGARRLLSPGRENFWGQDVFEFIEANVPKRD